MVKGLNGLEFEGMMSEDMLTSIEGMLGENGFKDSYVYSNGINCNLDNDVLIIAAMLLVQRYSQKNIVSMSVLEHHESQSELSVYTFDFSLAEDITGIIKQWKKKRIVKVNHCIPFLLEIYDESFYQRKENNNTDTHVLAEVWLKVNTIENQVTIEVSSLKYKLVGFVNYFRRIIDCILKNNKYHEINIFDQSEIHQQLCTWNDTFMKIPKDKCIHHFIEEKAMETPNNPAVIFENNIETYGLINEKANKLARFIISKYGDNNSIIALHMEKNIEMVIGVLAVLKLGCAYLPMDSNYPPERIRYMLEDSQAQLILTHESLLPHLGSVNVRLLVIDQAWKGIEKQPPDNLGLNVSPDDTAYIIYTSGSTGKPKGVILNHCGRVNNFMDFNKRFHIDDRDRILSVSSLSFDMCAYDVLGTLMAGGVIVLPDKDMSLQSFHWLSLIDEKKITIWHSVPTMLEMLCTCKTNRKNRSLESIRLVLLGGDWISTKLPERFKAFNEQAKLISLGGATEVSMDSIIYEIKEIPDSWISIPYGRPMYNQTAYILGEDLSLLPLGAIGELYIGGIGVADGYFRRDTLTSERFIKFEYNGVRDRIYKTGDLARFLEDGCIQLIGRNDFQVKIDGVRIELGEIEKTLLQLPMVKNAVCLSVSNAKGRKKLIAAIELEDKTSDELGLCDTIQKHLRGSLIEKYVPEFYLFLNDIPTTPNGKIDRNSIVRQASEKWGYDL